MPEHKDLLPPTIEYESLHAKQRKPKMHKILLFLAILSMPFVLITGLAAFDGAINPHSDFGFLPWLGLFGVSLLFPILWCLSD